MNNSPKVLITGGTGLLGKEITKLCVQHGFHVHILSRSPKEHSRSVSYYQWNVSANYLDEQALDQVQFIIHLAGASIAKRWTKDYKKEIIDSRVNSSNLILNALKNRNQKIKAFISASASGFYQKNQDIEQTEDMPAGNDFLAEVCQQWEQSANQFLANSERIVIHRIGMILSSTGGALEPIVNPIKKHIAPILGSGKQDYPWIHINDVANRFLYSLQNSVSGTFNANTDNCTQIKLNQEIQKVLNTTAMSIPAPQFILQLVMGEMSSLVLDGIKMNPSKLENFGFKSQFEDLQTALTDLLKK